jgi:WD40 repeat protein
LSGRLWDVKTEKEVAALVGHDGAVRSVAFAPSGRRVVSGGADKTVRVWDLGDRKEIHKFEGHTGEIHSINVSSDGRYALSMTDKRDAELAIWWRLPEDPDQDQAALRRMDLQP